MFTYFQWVQQTWLRGRYFETNCMCEERNIFRENSAMLHHRHWKYAVVTYYMYGTVILKRRLEENELAFRVGPRSRLYHSVWTTPGSDNQLTHAKIVQVFDPPASVCLGFLKFTDTEGLSGWPATQQRGLSGQQSMKTSSCPIIIII